jgi:deoxyribodipyrimidine photo-lyase
MTAIVWFRRDLRIRDHPALHAACRDAERVVPVFVLDERLLHGRHRSGARTQFLLECLDALDHALRGRGSRLVIRRGDPVTELPALAREVGANTVHAAVDAGPFARRRDLAVAERLAACGIRLRGHPGVFVVDDLRAVRTTGGTPYTVFTPFHRAWLQTPRRAVHRAAPTLPPLPGALDPGAIPSLAELRLDQPLTDPAPGGEPAGRKAMSRVLGSLVEGYDDTRNELGQGGLAPVALPALRLYLPARAREPPRRCPRAGGAPQATVLAGLLRPGPAPLPGQRPSRASAALPRPTALER